MKLVLLESMLEALLLLLLLLSFKGHICLVFLVLNITAKQTFKERDINDMEIKVEFGGNSSNF